MNNSDVILYPILTEKSSTLMESLNKYVFRVNVKSNKIQIKNALEKRFKVSVIKVTTMNFKGKVKNTTIREYLDLNIRPYHKILVLQFS